MNKGLLGEQGGRITRGWPKGTWSMIVLCAAVSGYGEEVGVRSGPESLTLKANFVLQEIVIIGSRTKESAFESPRAVSVMVKDRPHQESQARTVPEAAKELTGVFLQKTTHGHGAPIVRGLIGRDVLSLVDGIRLNNSTYRSGPVQYLNTVDFGGVERIELVRGPGSVLYGSDALGGALNVRTSMDFPMTPLAVKVNVQGQSADRGVNTRWEAAGSDGALGYRVGASAKSFGDLRAGGGYGLEAPTAYRETDGDAVVKWQLDASQAVNLVYQGIGQYQVPRYHHYQGALSVYGVPAFQRFTYDQFRHLGIVRYEGRGVAGFEGLEAAVSWQRQTEGNQQQKINSPTVSELEDQVDTVGGYGQVKPVWGDHALLAGVEAYGDRVQSQAWSVNASSGLRTAKMSDSTFPDGSTHSTLGMFLQDQWKVGPAVEVTPGVRWSRFSYHSTIRNAPLSGLLDESFQDATGTMSVSVGVAPGWRVMGTVGQGFRAPNLDDLVTLRTTNQGVDVPVSSALKPEKALMGEVGVKALGEAGEGSIFFYGMHITDRIVRKAGTYQGLSFIDGNGNGVQDAGELPVFQKQNIGQALMYGVETDGLLRLIGDVSAFFSLVWTYGHNITDGEALSKIPPLNGRLGARYAEATWWVEGFTQFAGRQDRLSSTDKADPRMDPGGTAAWATLNVRGGVDVSEGKRLNVGMANLLDAGYREHGSGIDAPGFNLLVGMEVQF